MEGNFILCYQHFTAAKYLKWPRYIETGVIRSSNVAEMQFIINNVCNPFQTSQLCSFS